MLPCLQIVAYKICLEVKESSRPWGRWEDSWNMDLQHWAPPCALNNFSPLQKWSPAVVRLSLTLEHDADHNTHINKFLIFQQCFEWGGDISLIVCPLQAILLGSHPQTLWNWMEVWKQHGWLAFMYLVLTLFRSGITDLAKITFWHQDTWGALRTEGLYVGRVKPGLKVKFSFCNKPLLPLLLGLLGLEEGVGKRDLIGVFKERIVHIIRVNVEEDRHVNLKCKSKILVIFKAPYLFPWI